MSSGVMDDARRDGASFARTYFETALVPYTADPAVNYPAFPLRTTGRFNTGAYTPAALAYLRSTFTAALDAGSPGPAQWVDLNVKAAWREAAVADFEQRLTAAVRFSAPAA